METKRYPFKFSQTMIWLFVAALLLCAAAFGVTLWRFIRFLQDGGNSAYQWIQFSVMFLLSVLFFVLVVAMLFRSEYVITEKYLITRFGLISSKIELKSICSIHLFEGAQKLTLYFDDFRNKYAVLVVKPSYFDDIVRTLTERNPKIGFSFSTAEEEDEFKKK